MEDPQSATQSTAQSAPQLAPKSTLEPAQTAIIVGALVEKNGKYLLVQEGKEKCRGKWSFPAGHLEPGETFFEGAAREVKEETGCDVELTGICQLGNHVSQKDVFALIMFTATTDGTKFSPLNHTEILDVKWFTYEEILAMRDQLRVQDLIIGAIDNVRQGIVAPLNLVQIYHK